MARRRISTTVDDGLLSQARLARAGVKDATLFDEALMALIRQHRSSSYDEAYAVYGEHPLDEPDEWGDLASFRAAAGST
ncbi:MAG: type II toxin-antitoxin system VapB family antitoxin [Acidimicrobiia bacterium]